MMPGNHSDDAETVPTRHSASVERPAATEVTEVAEVTASSEPLFRFDLWATIVFSVVAVAAAIFPGPLRIPFAVLSCVLFALGTVAFLWAYGKALERSRDQDVSVAMIYGMTVAPRAVRLRFHLLTFVQSAVAIATAAIRPFTSQAFGILAPMLGIGLAGLWAARHGTFAERTDGRHKTKQAQVARERARESKSNG